MAKKDERKLSLEEVLAQVPGTRAVLKDLADRLGISRETLRKYIKQWKSLQVALENEKESLKDQVEAKVYKRVLGGKHWPSQKMFLERQCRDRGWGKEEILEKIEELRVLIGSQDKGGADNEEA